MERKLDKVEKIEKIDKIDKIDNYTDDATLPQTDRTRATPI